MRKTPVLPTTIPRSAFRSATQWKSFTNPARWKLDIFAPIPGPRIAFSRFDAVNGSQQIYSMNDNGTGQVNLSNSTYYDACPEWWR